MSSPPKKLDLERAEHEALQAEIQEQGAKRGNAEQAKATKKAATKTKEKAAAKAIAPPAQKVMATPSIAAANAPISIHSDGDEANPVIIDDSGLQRTIVIDDSPPAIKSHSRTKTRTKKIKGMKRFRNESKRTHIQGSNDGQDGMEGKGGTEHVVEGDGEDAQGGDEGQDGGTGDGYDGQGEEDDDYDREGDGDAIQGEEDDDYDQKGDGDVAQSEEDDDSSRVFMLHRR